jgi:hypothetical protein
VHKGEEKYISNRSLRERRHNSVMETDHERERMRKAGNIATWPM